MYSIGIDSGYSSVKVSVLKNNECIYNNYVLHRGAIKLALIKSFEEIKRIFPLKKISTGAFTGSGSRFITEKTGAAGVNETASLIEGVKLINKNIKSIIEIGGETSKFVTGIENGKSNIEISMNTNCSAGTGSFLEEQMSGLNLNIERYSDCVSKFSFIPSIAGRCSVFAKTDIIHHQQEGVSIDNILIGLAYAVIKSFRGSVIKKRDIARPVLFAGGVAYNQAIIYAVRDIFKLPGEELAVFEHPANILSIGTASIAYKNKNIIAIDNLIEFLKKEDITVKKRKSRLLSLARYGKGDSENKHIVQPFSENKTDKYYMGIDVGSTSVNIVIINNRKEVVEYEYVRTHGDPVEAVRKCFEKIMKGPFKNLVISGAGTTGSGRYMIGELIGADVIKDEITAQAAASIFIDKDVDTIFEIGGQDSKYIRIEHGNVVDFQMNKVCAAGTGSFIEEQAKKFAIPVDDFGVIALKGGGPVELAERCAVFIESSIAAHTACGETVENIAAGLCYAIVKNYLNRVVGEKKIGKKIFLQGGIAYNQGIINAFRALTGAEIVVPPFFSVTGAYGAALITLKEMGSAVSSFKGFIINDFGRALPEKTDAGFNEIFNKKIKNIVFDGYNGIIDPSKKTIGIPRALFTYGMYSMFSTIFRELGFNILLSGPSSPDTVELAREYAQDELCYPMKIINGHIAELIDKKVDYIFFPDLHTVAHPGSASRQNYGCAYMQLAFKIIRQNMNLDAKNIKLLSPAIVFNMGEEFMKKSFYSLGEILKKSPEEIDAAVQKGVCAAGNFEMKLKENSIKECSHIKDEKIFILVSKIYGIADPVLNMGVPGKLMEMGHKVMPFFELPEGDVSAEHPNMYWPFGQHILEAAQLIKRHPNMYAILFTHHCCGPDSTFTHYFREIMGDKPFLNIEVDEHSSAVGTITRLEAFINCLDSYPAVKAPPISEICSGIKK